MAVNPAPEERMNWRNLIAASAAVCVFSFSLGEMYPLLSLKLEAMGVSPDMIGLNAAMSPIGILVAGLFISRLAHRFGAKPVALWAAGLTGLVLISYPLLDYLWAWFALRFLQGALVAVLFALSESWVIAFAHGKYRARVTAIYASVISASFGAGAGVLGITGIDGMAPFLVGACVMWLAVPVIALVDAPPSDEEQAHVGFVEFLAKAPLLLFAIAVHAVFDGAMIGFFPIYAVEHGFSVQMAALTVTALALGNFFLQLPIGWLADHMPKGRVMTGCFILCALGMLAVGPLVDTIWIWPLLPLIGAAGFGIYSVGLAMLGDRFSGRDLVAGTAAFSSMWGLGALGGSVIAGYSMEALGPEGLPLSMLLLLGSYVALQALRLFQMRRASRS